MYLPLWTVQLESFSHRKQALTLKHLSFLIKRCIASCQVIVGGQLWPFLLALCLSIHSNKNQGFKTFLEPWWLIYVGLMIRKSPTVNMKHHLWAVTLLPTKSDRHSSLSAVSTAHLKQGHYFTVHFLLSFCFSLLLCIWFSLNRLMGQPGQKACCGKQPSSPVTSLSRLEIFPRQAQEAANTKGTGTE